MLAPVLAFLRPRLPAIAPFLLFCAVGLTIGMFEVHETGPLWPDAPRYANAGAMVHDYLEAGQLRSPFEFAKENYVHYPAFNVPYHPPGYPVALGIWFQLTEFSYVSCRLFVACCWVIAGWCFYRINRVLGVKNWPACAAGLLMLTTPHLAMWSRDSMSEVPGMAVAMAAALFWVKWLRRGSLWALLAAFALAEMAFFFRVTTVAVLPGFVGLGWLAGRVTGRRLLWVVLLGSVLLAVNVSWLKFAGSYAVHEINADGRDKFAPLQGLQYFHACLPGIVAGGSACLAVAGLAGSVIGRTELFPTVFWTVWFASCVMFKMAVPSSMEVRHFFMALPAFAGLAVGLFPPAVLQSFPRALAMFCAVGLGLLANLWVLKDCPPGVVGYQRVGAFMAQMEEPGNVLLACWEDQEFIFRYRTSVPTRDRYLIRSDRTLAIRVSEYAKVAPVIIGTTDEDVIKVVQTGRAGYVLSCAPIPGTKDFRQFEMKLVHEVVQRRPDLFQLVETFPVTVDYYYESPKVNGEVSLWKYTRPFTEGPPQFPIVIPTASMTLTP